MFVTNTSIGAIYSLINLTDTTMNDQDKLVTLHTYSNNVDASIARDVLENAGISCMLTNETFWAFTPLDTPHSEASNSLYLRKMKRTHAIFSQTQTTNK